MKRLLMIIFMNTTEAYLTKEMCAYPYYLGKDYGWSCTYAYFTNEKPLKNALFERYCALQYLGKADNYTKQEKIAAEYLKDHARDIDVLCFFHYGGASYSLARLAKKINPKIKVYIKLDMSEDGFSHFYDGTFLRKVHLLPEYWKSRAVDLFTVENRSFYKILEEMRIFRKRIKYLPNAVSLFGAESVDHTCPKRKENIVLTVGRLGDHVKNNELLVEAMRKVDREIFDDWKVFLVGPAEAHFVEYVNRACEADAWMAEHLVLFGEVRDRTRLYDLYARAKIMCMTSRSESFCIALMEAMYFGAYPIITNFGRIVEDFVPHSWTEHFPCGHNGIVVPQEDVDELVVALEKTAADEKLPCLCQDVERFARDNFSYDVWAKELDGYLTDLLTR